MSTERLVAAFAARCLLLAVVGIAMMGGRATPASAASVGHYRVTVGRAVVNVVRIDLEDPKIRVMPLLAPSLPQRANPRATFRYFLECYNPVAAINGTFFDTRTYRIIGNLAVHGRLLREGYVGNAIAIDRDNRPSFVKSAGRMGRHCRWADYRAAIGGGVTLVLDGKKAVNPRSEGFRDPGLFRPARRSAVGYTRDRKLLMVSVRTGVSIHQLATIMQKLGASCALSLDGGTSSALYYRGKVLASPGRPLTNLLAVFEDGRGGRLPLGVPAILRHDSAQPSARHSAAGL